MATSSEDAIGLKQALDYDGLQKQYYDLQNSFKEISEKNTTLQHDADKAKTELEAIKSLKLATELSKKEIEEQLQDFVQNESRLRAINTKTYEQLCEKRDALQKVQDELAKLRQKEIEKAIEVENARSNILKLTETKHELESKLSITVSRENKIGDELKSLQRDYDNYRSDCTTERSRLLEQISDLKREKENATDSADQLRLQLDHAKQNIVNADDKLNTITREKDQLKLNLGATSKSYKELLDLYEEHVAHTDKKISNYESKIASIAGERDALQAKKNELERHLEEEKELRKVHFKQLTGAIETTNSSGDTQSSSNLLNLIRDYQKLNRHPEDIYQEFFELRAKYLKVLAKNKQATDVADTMTRKLNENENLFSRLHRELNAAKLKVNDLSQNVQDEKVARVNLEKSNKSLTNAVNDLTEDKKKLEASLKDTTYQLQYLLSDVQRRNEPIPAPLQESARLLTNANIVPGLPHDQLVFKNVAELQDLNNKLVSEVRTLTEKVQSTSNEISTANIKQTSDVEFYKTALNEAKQTMTDLSSKSKDLQKQLDTMTVECTNYKNLISHLGDGDANTRFEQMKQTQLRQREEMDITFETYREETNVEINKLKEELETTRMSAIEARGLLTQVNVEIAHLRRKQINLTSTVEQRDEEIKIARRQNSTLQERVASRDRDLLQAKEELADLKSRVEILRNENVSLNSRIESATTAYNTIKETVNSDSAQKVHMNHLLEAINNRMESFASSATESADRAKETIEQLNRELQHSRDALAVAEKELDSYKSIDQQEIKEKYKESVIEIRLLQTKISEIEQQLSNINQERIIAQTKLAAVEEQLKNASASSAEGAASNNVTGDSTTCDEHVRLLAEAEDRIRVLEADIENYHTTLAEKNQKTDAAIKEHDKFVTETQIVIDKLIKDLEVKTADTAAIQGEADKSIAEYKVLHAKVLAVQDELLKEKHTLEEKVKELDADKLTKESDLKSLREVVDEKTAACTEAETKLAAVIKTNEEHRQTIITLRADVSNLTFEISEYKKNADASKATMEALTADKQREASERAEFEESLKKSLAESEKQREKLVDRVEELVKKHAEWQAAVEKGTGGDNTAFDKITEDIIQQLREANETLRIERDANESKYRYERDSLKRFEAEIIPIKYQVVHLQADCDRLREENEKLSEQGSAESGSYRMQCDAFKVQNQSLIKENERLRERREHAQAELDKKNAELSPLIVKVNTLEAQLKQSQDEIDMLTKSNKEWSSRSAQLLSKYNRVDPAEIEHVKSELEATKTELETVKAQKTELETTVATLQTQIKAGDAERFGLINRANERGRMALEFKKKMQEAELKLKQAEAAKATASTQNNNYSKLVKEKEAAELANKNLEEEKKKAEEAKTQAEEERKKSEEALKVRMDEYTNLSKKYQNILLRARALQQEKMKLSDELKTLKESGDDKEKSESPALKAKIAELENELVTVRKTLADNSVELTRLKAQSSMAQNKSNRLQKELDSMKAAKTATTSTLSAEAPAFQVSSPTIGSPSVPQVSSPVIGIPQPSNGTQALPKVASPLRTKGKQAAAIAVSNVNTPDLSSTPAAASVDTPILTPVSTSTPPPTTIEIEEANVDTPPISSNEAEITTETDELHVPVPEETLASTPSAAAEVDADLSMEEEVADIEVNEDIADATPATAEASLDTTKAAEVEQHVEGTDELIDETPVEVEVHEVNTDHIDSPQIDASEETVLEPTEIVDDNRKTTELPDSPVVLQQEEAAPAATTEGEPVAEVSESNVETQTEDESLDPVVGSKRKERSEEEGEEGEVATPGSPSKKVHTTTEE